MIGLYQKKRLDLTMSAKTSLDESDIKMGSVTTNNAFSRPKRCALPEPCLHSYPQTFVELRLV